jgi:hypothetical protein
MTSAKKKASTPTTEPTPAKSTVRRTAKGVEVTGEPWGPTELKYFEERLMEKLLQRSTNTERVGTSHE